MNLIDPIQEIGPKLGGGCSFKGGRSFPILQYRINYWWLTFKKELAVMSVLHAMKLMLVGLSLVPRLSRRHAEK